MRSVIAAVHPIVFIYQLSPCWAVTVKTQVNGWLRKSALHLIEPQFPRPIMYHDTVTLAQSWWKRNSLSSSSKRNRRSSNRYVNEAIVPAGSPGIRRAVLESTFSYLWKTALTYHKTFLAHNAKQLTNRQISLMMMHSRHMRGSHLGQRRLTPTRAV